MPKPKRTVPARINGKCGYEVITELAERGVRQRDIARALGMSRNTLRRILNEDQKAMDAYEAGRCVEHEALRGFLFTQAERGNVAAAMFLLKARHGYIDNPKPEPQGNRVRLEVTLPMPFTETQYLQDLAARQEKNITPPQEQLEEADQ